MTANIIIFIIFLSLCVFYWYATQSKAQKDMVLPTFAGSSDETHCSCHECNVIIEKSRVIKLPNGKFDNTKNYHRIRIVGTCMTPLHINNDEEWLAKKINQQDFYRNVKVGDVLLIYLADKNIYKIRRVRSFLNDDMLETYSYDANGREHISSRPHSIHSVMGIVKYRL